MFQLLLEPIIKVVSFNIMIQHGFQFMKVILVVSAVIGIIIINTSSIVILFHMMDDICWQHNVDGCGQMM